MTNQPHDQSSIAYGLYQNENFGEALDLVEEILSSTTPANDFQRVSGALITAGLVRIHLGPVNLAIENIKEGLSILDTQDDPCLRARAYVGLSQIYSHYGDLLIATSYAQRGISIAEENDLLQEQCDSLAQYGSCLAIMSKNEQSIGFFEKSLAIARSQNDPNREATILNNLAMSLINLNQLHLAEQKAGRALEIIQNSPFLYTKTAILDTLGIIYSSQGHYLQAIDSFKKAIDLITTKNLKAALSENYLNLGKVQISAAFLEEAEKNLGIALEMSEQESAVRIVYSCHKELANLFELKNDFAKALYHFKQYFSLFENNIAFDKAFDYAQHVSMHKTETAQKDAEIVRLKNQILIEQLANQQTRTSLLEYQSITDPLTGLFNRRHLEKHGAEMVAAAITKGSPLSVILIDIDHFKQINDTYGHLSGDRVITNFAQILTSVFRQSDLCCRYGGEEFFIALPDTNEQASADIGERFRSLIEGLPIEINNEGTTINITISVGVASLSPADKTLDTFLRRADEALYKAKNTGRNLLVLAGE